MAIGVGGNCVTLMPDLNLVVVAASADWGSIQPGKADAVMNQRLKQIVVAGTPVPAGKAVAR
jgi:hypothetical protein